MTEAAFSGQAPNPFMARLAELLAKIKAGMEKGTDAPLYDPMTGDTLPAGASLQAVSELSGLPGAQKLVERMAWGHPAADNSAPSLAGKYSDVLDTAGLAAGPLTGLAKAGPRVVKGLAEAAVSGPRAGSKAAQRGAIRAGGDPKTTIAHATTVDSLEQAYRGLGGSALYSPSLGIKYDQVPDFQSQHDTGSVFLIPKVGAFDPATSTSTLYNRDAYLPRHGQFHGVSAPSGENLVFDRGLANTKLPGSEGTGKIPRDDPRRGVFQTTLGGIGHKAALANSPHFSSYAQFEASPAGLETLKKGRKESISATTQGMVDRYMVETTELIREHVPGATSSELNQADAFAKKLLYSDRATRAGAITELASFNPKLAEDISRLAAHYRQKFSRVPSEYAELQNYGLTPLNQENWAGAFVTGGEQEAQRLQKIMGLPIEVFRPGTIKPKDINDFQQSMGLARRQPIGVGLASGARMRLPEVAKQKTATKTGANNPKVMGASLPPASPVDQLIAKAPLEQDFVDEWLKAAKGNAPEFLGEGLKIAADLVAQYSDAGSMEMASNWAQHAASIKEAIKQSSMPDLLGAAPAPDASLVAKFGPKWDVMTDDQEVAQHLFEQYGNTLEGEKFLPLLEKLPSWSQDNVIKVYMKLAGKEAVK